MPAEIDLRSDTVTKPTPQMRRAMADAEVGDAVIDVDPTVERLEALTAEILGKETAVFMPSGSMTNQIALRVHCGRSSEFLCEADCHIYHYEQGAFAQLSGLVAQTVAGDGGVLQVDQLKNLIRPENEHMVRTQLVCLENTHNRWGGRILPQKTVEEICDWARQNGLKRHLDGARLWNASVATGISPQKLVEPFDSVSVCFSKGLGAPVGSALAGDHSVHSGSSPLPKTVRGRHASSRESSLPAHCTHWSSTAIVWRKITIMLNAFARAAKHVVRSGDSWKSSRHQYRHL